MSGRLLVGCGVLISYYIYKSGAAIGCRCSSLSVGRGAAVLMSGGSRSSCRILSGCRLVLMVSPDVGRVSRSSCRDRLPLLFVVSWSGCRLLLMVSPDGWRVSRSSCRDRLPLLFDWVPLLFVVLLCKFMHRYAYIVNIHAATTLRPG